MQECYSLRYGRSGRDPVVFGTLRSLRSAAGHFFAWDAQLATNGSSYMDTSRRVVLAPCRLTDNLAYSLFTQGQATRIGEHSSPSTALLYRHIKWLDTDLHRRFQRAHSLHEHVRHQASYLPFVPSPFSPYTHCCPALVTSCPTTANSG